MISPDPLGPDLQYVVKLEIVGTKAAGALVDRVQVRHIAGLRADGTIVDASTPAEACIADILRMVELPPGRGPASMETVIRYADCLKP